MPEIDEKLWFTMDDCCPGKHYLLAGNPHTFYGRMLAWCPNKKISFRVSKMSMEAMSPETVYWVKGFLSGNEPEPPRDSNNDFLSHSDPAFDHWLASVNLFLETGYWNVAQRFCERCKKELLLSNANGVCSECQ